jgi:probable F420-dependent oxidoreductase
LILHAFTTEAYVRQVTVPTVEAALAAGGRTRGEFEIGGPIFVVTGSDSEEMGAAAAEVRQHVAFYGSTPSYRPVLEIHGWGDIGDQLNAMSKRGEWEAMTGLVTDEMLETFAVVAPPDDVAPALLERYGDLLDRITLSMSHQPDPEVTATIVAGLAGAPA